MALETKSPNNDFDPGRDPAEDEFNQLINKNFSPGDERMMEDRARKDADEDKSLADREASGGEDSEDGVGNEKSDFGHAEHHDNQVGRGYRPQRGSGKAGLRNRLGNRRFFLAIGIMGSLIIIPLVFFLAFFLPSLKIPHLAAEIESYRLARLSRTFYNNATILTTDNLAVEANPDATVGDLVGKTPLGKALSLYKPQRVITSMKANNVLGFEYNESGKLTNMVVNLPDGTSAKVAVPDYKYSLNPKDIVNNYKERLRVATETQAAVNQALDGSNFLVRGKVARLLESANGVHLYWWERAGLSFNGKSDAAADALEAQLTEQRINQIPTEDLRTASLKEAADEIEKEYSDCFASESCTEDAIANDGVPTQVKNSIAKVKASASQAMDVLSPLYSAAFPVCIAYDASTQSATPSINAQSQEAMRTFFAVASGSDQIKTGDTTGPAVGALNRQAGDTANSIPNQLASGSTVDTSGEISPESGPSGDFSVLNVFDKLLGGSGNDTKTRVANWFAKEACGTITSQTTGLTLLVINGVLLAIPGEGEVTESAEQGTLQAIRGIGENILSNLKNKVFSFNAIRNTAVSAGETEAASQGLTYLARMLVFSHSGMLMNALDRSGFANLADKGGEAYAQAMMQSETFGRPLTKDETAGVEKQDLSYLNSKNQDQSVFNRYLAVSNPYSLTGQLAITASNWKMSDVANIFTNFPHFLSNIFSPIGALLNQHALAATNGSADYGMVQFGWSTDEENLMNSDPTYDPLVNAQILQDSGQSAAIAQKYAKCFGYTADDQGNLTYDPNDQIGNLLGGNSPSIQRNDDGSVIADSGDCSPQNLTYTNNEFGPQMVFRWRVNQAYLSTQDELNSIQDVGGSQ